MKLGIGDNLGQKNVREWIETIQRLKLSCVVAPVTADSPKEEQAEYLECIKEHKLTVGETGIWRNVINPDSAARRQALDYAKRQLAFADEIGANCCVNIAGAAGEVWDGYYPENYAEDTYAQIVDTVREIIDAVKPVRTFYTLEPMYWMHPDSPDDYLKMIKDIDRKQFAIHMDYVNMINSFDRYNRCDAFVKECFEKLGAYTKSVHVKDIALKPVPTVCLTETLPGTGRINFRQVFRLIDKLDRQMPVFVEHLKNMQEYEKAIHYLQSVYEVNNEK